MDQVGDDVGGGGWICKIIFSSIYFFPHGHP